MPARAVAAVQEAAPWRRRPPPPCVLPLLSTLPFPSPPPCRFTSSRHARAGWGGLEGGQRVVAVGCGCVGHGARPARTHVCTHVLALCPRSTHSPPQFFAPWCGHCKVREDSTDARGPACGAAAAPGSAGPRRRRLPAPPAAAGLLTASRRCRPCPVRVACLQRMAPTWDQLGDAFKDSDKVVIASVDCTEQKDVCTKAEVGARRGRGAARRLPTGGWDGGPVGGAAGTALAAPALHACLPEYPCRGTLRTSSTHPSSHHHLHRADPRVPHAQGLPRRCRGGCVQRCARGERSWAGGREGCWRRRACGTRTATQLWRASPPVILPPATHRHPPAHASATLTPCLHTARQARASWTASRHTCPTRPSS